jgi:hypothetical protein
MSSLSEINKTLKEQLSAIEYGNRGTDDLRAKFGAFVSGMKGAAGDRLEREREEARRKGRVAAAGPQGMGRGFGSALGGLGKLAGIAGFLGIAGLAAMQFLDGKKIAENVEAILGIGERYSEDTLKTLLSDGAVILALKGLGAGLLVFAAGGAASAGVNALDKATMDKFETSTGWSQNVKDNVLNLLSISDGLGESVKNLFKSALFVPAMTGLSAGLAIFAVGNTLAVGSEAFTQWTGATGWAQNIKDNVVTLLSIKDELGDNWEMLKDSGAFGLAMGGIGAGLALFGAGAIITGGTDMLSDWFSTGTNWAQQVVDNVTTLLSITDLPNIGNDTAGFVAVMGGIAAGLAAFGIGTGANALADLLADWVAEGEGRQNWTEELKKNVRNVLSIVDIANEGKAFKFAAAMGTISAGLVAFAGATFITGLTKAAEAILSFFTKQDNAFDQIMRVAENADDLEKGAAAVDSLTASIDRLGKLQFDGRRINMKAFALDLADSLKVIETAIDGGTFDASWLPFDAKTVKGLNSPDIDYSAAIKNIENLRAALRIGVTPGDVLDRYGNTFTLPTNLDTIPAFRSGSGFSDSLRLGGDGRGPMRIRPGFEENSLDALAEQARLNGNAPIIINQTDNSDNSRNSSSSTSNVATTPTTDNFNLIDSPF